MERTDEMTQNGNDGGVNAFLAIFSGIPAYIAALDPQTMTWISAIVLPCCFFALGKGADLLLRWWLETRKK